MSRDLTPSLKTEYRGTIYRSRLEARWAVFLDALDVPHLYEPEGFDLGDGTPYLVDFRLPTARIYLEIKPVLPSPTEIEKCRRLASIVPDDVRLLYGEIGWWRWRNFGIGAQHGGLGFYVDEHPVDGRIGAVDSTADYCPCICTVCGLFGIEYQGRPARMRCGHVQPGEMRALSDRAIMNAVRASETAQLGYEFQKPGR